MERRSVKRKRNTKGRRRCQLICSFLAMFVLIGFFMLVSAYKINAESDLAKPTYKYYTNVYIERGESLWSVANQYITSEYKNQADYIEEVMKINHLIDTEIEHGMNLYVPYYSKDKK